MNSAQTAFAALIAVFATLGAVLLINDERVAGGLMICFALSAFLAFVWMLIVSTLTRLRVSEPER